VLTSCFHVSGKNISGLLLILPLMVTMACLLLLCSIFVFDALLSLCSSVLGLRLGISVFPSDGSFSSIMVVGSCRVVGAQLVLLGRAIPCRTCGGTRATGKEGKDFSGFLDIRVACFPCEDPEAEPQAFVCVLFLF